MRRALVVTITVGMLTVAAVGADVAHQPFAEIHERLMKSAEASIQSMQAPPLPAERRPLVERELDRDQQIRDFARRHWKNQEGAVRRALGRVEEYRVMVDAALQAEGLPVELSAVMLVESAGDVRALSPAGARGLWQFIPATARRYGLQVGGGRDERLDAHKATRAAARYLRDLHIRFGSWELALAAYNAGEDAVERAIVRAASREFAQLSARRLLPMETRNYVPAVLAAMRLFGMGEALLGNHSSRSNGAGIRYAESKAGQ